MKLTQATIEKATYDGKSYLTKGGRRTWKKQIIWDEVVEGLGVRIFPTARKTFVLSYRDGSRKRTKTLGKFGPLTLGEARKQATEYLDSIGDAPTPDPVAAPATAGEIATFSELGQAYLDQRLEDGGSAALLDQRLIRLHINPALGRVAVSQVRRSDISRLSKRVAKKFPSDARRLSNLMRAMLKWASDQGQWQTPPPPHVPESRDRPQEDSSAKDEEAGPSSSKTLEPFREPDSPDESEAPDEETSNKQFATERPVLAPSPKTKPLEEASKDPEDLGAVQRKLEFELTSTRRRLKAVRQRAETEELELREHFEQAETRANTLSLSVQQLQAWREEAESEQERSNRQLKEALEREEKLTREVATLTNTLWQRDERDRLRSQLGAPPPSASGAPSVTAALLARRPSAPWLLAVLALGMVLGAVLVVTFRTMPEASSLDPQIAEARPPVMNEVAGPALSPGSAPFETPAGTSPANEENVVNVAEETTGEKSPEEPGAPDERVDGPDLAGVEATVRAWAASWSEQRVDDYLAFYSGAFDPPGSLTRGEWEEQRRSRILRPNRIRLSVGAITSTVFEPDRVRADFDQAYATEAYSDETRKTLVLEWDEGAWKITDERSE